MPQRLSDNVIGKLLSISQVRFGLRMDELPPLGRVVLLRQLADELAAWADCIEEFSLAVASAERARRDELRGIQLRLFSERKPVQREESKARSEAA